MYYITNLLTTVNFVQLNIQVCRSSLLSGRNVRWLRRMLSPGESWRAGTDRQTDDGRTDGRKLNRYITLSAIDAASVID